MGTFIVDVVGHVEFNKVIYCFGMCFLLSSQFSCVQKLYYAS